GERVLDDVEAACAQLPKETRRIADAGNGVQAPPSKLLERLWGPLTVEPPRLARDQSHLQRSGVHRRCHAHERCVLRHAVHHDGIRCIQSGYGLAQRPRWQHTTVAESPHAIDHDDFAITRQAQVLQAVVGDHHVDSLLDEGARPSDAIARDDRGAAGATLNKQRLVADFAPTRIGAHDAQRAYRAPVTARHDAYLQPSIGQLPRQPDDQRRLTRAADRQIADHDYRLADGAGAQPAARIRAAARLHYTGVQPRQWLQQKRPCAVAIPQLGEPLLHSGHTIR